jgi:hypothetical protein
MTHGMVGGESYAQDLGRSHPNRRDLEINRCRNSEAVAYSIRDEASTYTC